MYLRRLDGSVNLLSCRINMLSASWEALAPPKMELVDSSSASSCKTIRKNEQGIQKAEMLMTMKTPKETRRRSTWRGKKGEDQKRPVDRVIAKRKYWKVDMWRYYRRENLTVLFLSISHTHPHTHIDAGRPPQTQIHLAPPDHPWSESTNGDSAHR